MAVMNDAVPGRESEPGPVDAASRPGQAPSVALRSRVRAEILIVLGLSLGQAAVTAILQLLRRLSLDVPLGEQTAALNPSRADLPTLDLIYQIASIVFTVLPVALAIYLLASTRRRATARIGLDLAQPARDLGHGFALAALIGIPGLGLYVAGRALGVTVEIQAAALDMHWWTVPILVLAALQYGLLEEVIAVAYLTEKLEELAWHPAAIVVSSALLRGTYHLYQGFGAFVGNVIMGLIFAEYYRRRRRVMPLVIAHMLLDLVAFVGYMLLPASFLASLGI